MNDLRKAAEQALEVLECLVNYDIHFIEDGELDSDGVSAIDALRQALDLQTTIEKGTKAWADVPNASEWVEELRGNDKPPVKSYCGGKPNYCTPEEAFTLDRGCWERGCVAYDTRDGDGVIVYVEPALKEKNT